MTKELPLVLVDTCIVVDFLTGRDPAWQESARWTLEQHERTHRVVLPAIVVPEITGNGAIRGEEGGAQIRAARLLKAREWLDQAGYIVAELSGRLARQAADLAVKHNLKGADATVLASALAWRCTTLCTRDQRLLDVDGVYPGLSIGEVRREPGTNGLLRIDRGPEGLTSQRSE